MKRSVLAIFLLFLVITSSFLYNYGSENYVLARSVESHTIYFPVVQSLFVPSITPFATGIAMPNDVTNIVDPGDGRLFVSTKDGRILIVDADGNIQPQLLLDISDRVYSSPFEVGLLGLAVHPNFASNGYIYIYYNRMDDEDLYSDLARFTVTPSGQVDPQSELTLLHIQEPNNIHQGGALQFGPQDGYLYVATGDGGTLRDEAGFSQSLRSLHGKILRIDVDNGSPYAIPSDNPFANESSLRGEIWVYGLRNPWRFSFDRENGDMYIADVGDSTWEEINLVPAGSKGGQNFGWPCMEGPALYVPDVCDASKSYVMPIFSYAHDQDIHHCTVIGGYVYRGSQIPELWGSYLFADLCAGSIWALTLIDNSSWLSTRWTNFSENWSSFGERSDGELFLGDISSDKIYQLMGRP